MKFTVYSKEECPYCFKIKKVLELCGKEFVVYTLGEDFTKEEFYKLKLDHEQGDVSTSS